jgi:hypothetical protein
MCASADLDPSSLHYNFAHCKVWCDLWSQTWFIEVDEQLLMLIVINMLYTAPHLQHLQNRTFPDEEQGIGVYRYRNETKIRFQLRTAAYSWTA